MSSTGERIIEYRPEAGNMTSAKPAYQTVMRIVRLPNGEVATNPNGEPVMSSVIEDLNGRQLSDEEIQQIFVKGRSRPDTKMPTSETASGVNYTALQGILRELADNMDQTTDLRKSKCYYMRFLN